MTKRNVTIRLMPEALVVMLSILAAFGVDAWWDGRKDSVLERELLTTLQDGFEENRRQGQLVIREAEIQQGFIGRFIDMSAEEAAEISPDSVFLFLESLWRPNYIRPVPDGPQYGPDLNNAALLATLEAGRLPLLSDTRLLLALADWQGQVDFLVKRSAGMIALEREVLSAMTQFPEIQRALSGLDQMGGAPRVESVLGPRLLGALARRVREDNDMMSRVARKGFYSRIELRTLQDLSDQSDAVLRLLEENLRD